MEMLSNATWPTSLCAQPPFVPLPSAHGVNYVGMKQAICKRYGYCRLMFTYSGLLSMGSLDFLGSPSVQ